MSGFPLYKDDGISICHLTAYQEKAVEGLRRKIRDNVYRQVENRCICNAAADKDLAVAEKDRYGFSLPTVLCNCCGLIRSGLVFDDLSNEAFYRDDYRSIYVGAAAPPDEFFADQQQRGRALFDLFLREVGTRPRTVFEIGCGAGGILSSVSDDATTCAGCDFNEIYLQYGRDRGLDLLYGDYRSLIAEGSVELIILSHVMEHFIHPVEEMVSIVSKVAAGGFLLIEVPGVFSIHKNYINPLAYIQGAHAFSFHENYLRIFFKKIGLDVLYGDENSVFIVQKPPAWQPPAAVEIHEQSLQTDAKRVRKYLLLTDYLYRYRINPYYWWQTLKRAGKYITSGITRSESK